MKIENCKMKTTNRSFGARRRIASALWIYFAPTRLWARNDLSQLREGRKVLRVNPQRWLAMLPVVRQRSNSQFSLCNFQFSTSELLRPASCLLRSISRCLLLTASCRPLAPASCLLLLLLPPAPAHAQTVVDKMVATVNGGVVQRELITYSDLMWQLALEPGAPLEKPTSDDLNRVLRLVEDQRMILQEAKKLPTIAPTAEELKKARDELARQFASPAELPRRMERVGLISEQLDQIISDRVAIEKYLDFRFRAFVLISQKEIADYYNEVYVPRLRRRGAIVPTLDEARGEIEKILTESKIESDIDAFVDSLRDRAEIVILNPV